MYTQCPECGVAFRVTAEILKMAAGKVRCGGCGVAFNALDHLSEQKPTARAPQKQVPDPDLPELTPDEPAELQADTPPQSISAEQSAALLKTLDQLAGEDIRIEDTGIEWRVVDPDPDIVADTGSMKFIIEGDEPSQVVEEMRFDDDTPLPDDFDTAAAATSSPEPVQPSTQPEPETPQNNLDLSEPDEWQDLLGDLDESGTEVDADEEEPDEEEPDEEEPDEESVDELLDMDTQFAIQAEAMGIDLSGMHDMAADDEHEERDTDAEAEIALATEEAGETSIEDDLMSAAFEAEAAVLALEETASEAALELEDEVDEVDELEIDIQDDVGEEADEDIEDIAMGFDNEVEDVIQTIAASFDDVAEGDLEDEHEIPIMTEEEKTINMMIDQELFEIAVDDEDGFASTIVQRRPDEKVDHEVDDNKIESKKKKQEKSYEAPSHLVETIIMEGESVRGDANKKQPAADKMATYDGLDDPGVSFPINKTKDDYVRRREMTSGPPTIGMIAGVIVLVMILIVQVVHQSREALATVPAFNSAVGPVYRMLGKPLTPTWNISGWRFEATKGSTDDIDQLLTIYSRVGNNSEESLPYPLVHLSLTDRFEDIIGSTVLEPSEYLPENADPRRLVPPGNTFNAVISIDAPAEDVTGFKLNVCYRLASGQLRCAIEDFK